MPIYEFQERCECGEKELWTAEVIGDVELVCECGRPAKKALSMFYFGGDLDGDGQGGIHVQQLGRTFKNAKELDSWCEENNCHVEDRTSKAWTAIEDEVRDLCEEEAQELGYIDHDHRQSKRKEDARMHVAEVRARKIQEYTDKNGSEGKATVDDATIWGDALPT